VWVGTPQEMKGTKLVCGGKEHQVSDPSGDFFVECDQSSFNGEPYNCQSGFSGGMSDEEFKMWKVDEDSPTIWTSLKMSKTILPSRIEFHQPENQDEMVQKMIVH
jgi:hypothetical protein